MEVHEKKPTGFNAEVGVSACYLERDGKILLLQQGVAKPQTGAWGVPGGKIEKHETPEEAAYRELFEETGIQLEKPTQLQRLGCLYIRKEKLDFDYHLFRVTLEKIPSVCISQEHQSYQWFPIQNVPDLNLLSGGQEIFNFYQKRASKINRLTTVNAYLILKQKDKVLLHLRRNTGYFDGFYGLVSGHVEAYESAIAALMREAHEEAGITLKPSNLKVVHVMHRLTNRSNMDLFFECDTWEETITNKEPEKCGELKFFPIEQLPSNTIPYILDIMRFIREKVGYSEQGWAS